MLDIFKKSFSQVTVKAPILDQSPKLSIDELAQYLDEWPLKNSRYYKQSKAHELN